MKYCSTMKQDNCVSSGFSLIEIILVIAVIGSVFVMVLPNLGVIATSEAAGKLSTLSGDIRSTYDLAVLNKRPYRIGFEFHTGKYWLEYTERQDIYIPAEALEREATAEEIAAQEEVFQEDFDLYKDLAGKEVQNEKDEKMIPPTSPLIEAFEKLKPPKWEKVQDIEYRGRTLGPYYVIQDMQTEHHSRLIRLEEYEDAAMAYLYFFPNGYVEKAVIHINASLGDYSVDPNAIPFTVTTRPYEGLADIESGYVEVDIFENK